MVRKPYLWLHDQLRTLTKYFLHNSSHICATLSLYMMLSLHTLWAGRTQRDFGGRVKTHLYYSKSDTGLKVYNVNSSFRFKVQPWFLFGGLERQM